MQGERNGAMTANRVTREADIAALRGLATLDCSRGGQQHFAYE